MAILRKNNKDRFTVVSNEAIRDENLSLKALGLLVHLLSLPDDWQFSENGLMQVFKKDGQASIRSGLKELEDSGYLKRERKRDEKGHMASVEWIVYEKPHLEKPSLEDSNLGNRPQLNTKEIKDVMDKELNNTPPTPKGGKDNDNERIVDESYPESSEPTSTKKTKRFVKPTVAEVAAYCAERNNGIDAQYFVDFYEMRGWYAGKAHMKDWKAAVRTWESNDKKRNAQTRYSKQNQPMPTAADYGDECF